MSKGPIIIALIIVLLNAYWHLSAAVGCLDNSRSLTERFDYKEYHPVQCNCPCWKYRQSSDRCQCVKCGHYHDQRSIGGQRPHWSHRRVTTRVIQESTPEKKVGSVTLPTLYKQFKFAQE